MKALITFICLLLGIGWVFLTFFLLNYPDDMIFLGGIISALFMMYVIVLMVYQLIIKLIKYIKHI
jgi:hypothetical protein